PYTDGALHVDPASMFLGYDRACDREALAGPAADDFGGEEWIEDLVQILIRDAATVVRNGDDHGFPGGGGGDGDPTARGVPTGVLDGLGRIDHEVQEYLIQLADVALDVGDRIESRLDGGAVFVFVVRDDECGLDRAIDICRAL